MTDPTPKERAAVIAASYTTNNLGDRIEKAIYAAVAAELGGVMSASIESILIVARLDEMGVLALHDGQTLADLARAIDAIQQEPADDS